MHQGEPGFRRLQMSQIIGWSGALLILARLLGLLGDQPGRDSGETDV